MVNVVFESKKNRAAAYDDKKEVGESTFSRAEGFWIIDHTYVDENYGGQGIAKNLVAEIVEEARKNEIKILPLCPYAKKEFEKRPEYEDVWKR